MNLFNSKVKGGGDPKPSKPKMVGRTDIARRYAQNPSFADLMPWLEWSDEDDIVLLEDGRSVGAVFDIKAVPSEARPEAQISALHAKLVRLLSGILPLEDENPWVMQIFVQDDLTLKPVYKSLERYIAKNNNLNDPLAKKYLEVMDGHLKAMCEGDGLFTDPMSNLPFRGKIRRIRVTLYRRYSKLPKNSKIPDVVDEIKTVCRKFESQMRQVGIKVSRLQADRFYDWLVRWFNPKPKKAANVDTLLKRFPYPGNKKPFGWSFSQNIFFGDIESCDDGWLFDGVKHKVLTFRDLDSALEIGAVSREMNLGDNQKYAILDKFPPGAVYTIQITFESKAALETHLTGIEKAAIGKSGVIKDIRRNVDRARIEIDNKNMLFRCVEAIYFSAETDEELKAIETDLDSLLSEIQISIVETDKEIFPKDLYLRFLPFAFDYEFDKKHNFRSSYKYADDVARLLPVYGRSQGDGMNPLFLFFNRGGEPFMFGHLHRAFKMSNSHMAIVGTTGAGKSVFLNGMISALSSVYNPRIFALEVGGSFDLTAKYMAEHGRHVKTMKFERVNPILVNPYAEWEQALKFTKVEEAVLRKLAIEANSDEVSAVSTEGVEEELMSNSAAKLEHELETASALASEEELEAEEDRDYLQEMLLATRTMITGGKAEEEQGITRSDDMLISRALVLTMKRCEAAKVSQMLVQHVHKTFNLMAKEESNPEIGKRLGQFALNTENYLKGMRSHFVNGQSDPLPDADFTHVDFGFLQEAQYQDLLNVVCISLLAKILAVAEKNKSTGRPTILLIDEAHVFFKSPMIAAFIILMSKVARKIGLWIHPCTQNINDFTGVESRKVLSMMETWLCLSLDKEEVALIDHFKPLTDEMRALLLDVKKYPGIYSEGVLIGKRYSGLFRNVPPRLTLALAMTEQDERTARRKVQLEKGISELEAVEEIAKTITGKKQERSDEQFFLY